MKRSTIAHRVCLVGAGIAILTIVSATRPRAASAIPIGGCCDSSQARRDTVEAQYLDSSAGNPMGFQGFASPEQNAEEDMLDQGPAQVDAEVGAGEHDAVQVPRSAAQHSAGARRVTQGVGIFLALAVLSMGFRLIVLPSDGIPRIGGAGSRSDG
jgi:hypothetical protein